MQSLTAELFQAMQPDYRERVVLPWLDSLPRGVEVYIVEPPAWLPDDCVRMSIVVRPGLKFSGLDVARRTDGLGAIYEYRTFPHVRLEKWGEAR